MSNSVKQDEIRNIINKSIENSNNIAKATETLVSTSTSTDKIEQEVTLNVNPSLAQSIQARIIGARQQMSTMMSDVARQMYENYKPPVTAFRINLNPANLGTIAIIMKSDKDNAISISMNISNNSTLEAFVDSQNGLKNALNKTFSEDTTFNLDFNSNENNQSSSNNQNSNQNSNAQSNADTRTILESRENNKTDDKNLDYM